MAPAITERLGGTARRVGRSPQFFRVMIPIAATLLLFLSTFILLPSMETRIKGTTQPSSTQLSIFLKTADGAKELPDGSVGRASDVLQIAYNAGDAKYGVIFSIDGRGTLTFHLPQRYRGQTLVSPELEQQGQSVLPYAYELDNAPAFERFFFVYSRTPFDVSAVSRAAQVLASHPQTADRDSLRLPSGVGVVSRIVKK
jgi:hypothetical protein